jgi:hypothetical protein
MRIPQALEGRPSCSVPAPGLSLSPSGEDISSGPRTSPTSRFELDTEGRGRPGSCFPDQSPLPASAGLRRPGKEEEEEDSGLDWWAVREETAGDELVATPQPTDGVG